jgi:hypothetical protein
VKVIKENCEWSNKVKFSEANKDYNNLIYGRIGLNNPMYGKGKPLNKIYKVKLSLAKTGLNNSMHGRTGKILLFTK